MRAAIPMLAAAVLTIGCVTGGGAISDAAYRLDRSAEALHDEVRDRSASSDLRSEAREFANAARDFRRDVDDDADRDELREEFARVAERYHDLRDEYGDAREDSSQRSAFAEVTRAYLDLERELEYRRVTSR